MTSRAPTDIADLFSLLGGTGATARALDVGQSTASEMKRRKSIPVAYWPLLIRVAASRDIPLDEVALVAMHVADNAPAEAAS